MTFWEICSPTLARELFVIGTICAIILIIIAYTVEDANNWVVFFLWVGFIMGWLMAWAGATQDKESGEHTPGFICAIREWYDRKKNPEDYKDE